MPKLVLLDRGENVLTQWMFEADRDPNGGALTLKEPVHLAGLIEQLQEALERDRDSYVLTDENPHPCGFCGRKAVIKHSSPSEQFCSDRCMKEMSVFPKSVDWEAEYWKLHKAATELDVHKISCNIRLCDCGKVKQHE